MGLLKSARLLAVGCCLILTVGCDSRPKEWTAWVYPSASDLTTSTKLGGFKTFDDCQQAAINSLRMLPYPDDGDYECGYMCKFDPDMQINVCKETRK